MENLMIAILIFIKNSGLRRSVKNIIYNKKRGCFLTSTFFLFFYSDIHLIFKIISFQPLRQKTLSSDPGRRQC